MNRYTKAYIPYGGYYSTPFCRWQGSMQHDNAVTLGAGTARRWFLEKRKIDPTVIDYLYFGTTVAQHHWFFAHNWSGAMLTDDKKFVPGLFIHQACSTSTTILNLAAKDIELGAYEVGYGLMADRCSNGPHTVWPDPLGPGGQPDREDWNMDNFGGNPRHRAAMVETAENVAKEMSHYDFLAMPVVDANGRLIGIITYDDVFDIMSEEATEDMYLLANLDTDEKVYSPLARSVKLRVPWLLVNLCTALVASFTVSQFSETITRFVVLASLMPIVAGIGGNAGTQSLSQQQTGRSEDSLVERLAAGNLLVARAGDESIAFRCHVAAPPVP